MGPFRRVDRPSLYVPLLPSLFSHHQHTHTPTDVYYLAFPKDKPLPKAIVATCFVLEILQTTLSTRDAFRNFGTGWGNMIDLDAVGWLWFSVPVLGSVSTYFFAPFLAF